MPSDMPAVMPVIERAMSERCGLTADVASKATADVASKATVGTLDDDADAEASWLRATASVSAVPAGARKESSGKKKSRRLAPIDSHVVVPVFAKSFDKPVLELRPIGRCDGFCSAF